MKTSWEDRFWAKVDKNGPTPPGMSMPCWVWTANKLPSGYGIFCIPGAQDRRAHRIAWRLTHGPIPLDKHVCHLCDNPSCVNPEHLVLWTQKQNMEDRDRKKRDRPWGRTHLPSSLRLSRSGDNLGKIDYRSFLDEIKVSDK